MLKDVRFALRTLRRSPGFVAVAVASLALGIGANTAVFSLFEQVLLRSLPVEEPDRLVLFHTEGQDPGWAMADNYETVYSYPNYRDLRNRTTVFSGVAARAGAAATVMEPGGAASVRVEMVSGNFFDVLGVRAALGRTIEASDDAAPGANPVVVLSYGYWTRRHGGDARVLNARLLVNGQAMTVIGILDQRFLGVQSGQMPDVYAPLSMKQQISPGWDAFGDISGRWLNLIARLKPGISVAKAQAATRVLFRSIRDENLPRIRPMESREREEYLHRTVDLHPAAQGINMLSEFWRKPLVALMAMAGLVLLIACANLANLLIARAVAREKEIAVRAAVGAGRLAIFRQLITESLLLTSAAGAAGLLLANWALTGLLRLIGGEGDTGWVKAQVDFGLFAYAIGVAAIAGLVFGCAPLLQAWRVDLVTALKEQTGMAGRPARQRTRKALVAVQVALAVVLLSGAGLFARTLANLRHTNPGFQPANVLTFAIEPRLNGYDKPRTASLLRDVRARLSAVAGVEAVAYAGAGPFANQGRGTSLYIEGYTPGSGDEAGAQRDSVSAGYFRTLRIPIVAGREFNERDNAAGPKVAIINQALAAKYFHGRNPLGMHIGTDRKMDSVIVGIAKDLPRNSLRDTAEPFIYFPHEQDPTDRTYFLARGYGGDMAATTRAVVRGLDANLPVMDLRTMQSRVDESFSVERWITALAVAFGGIAAALAAVGLYGIVAFSVARRTAEIGVRVALGAARKDVYRLVLLETAVMLAAGALLGIPAALGLGRLIESQLFMVRPYDPVALTGAVAGLALVAVLAALGPARRAARIDPVQALRGE